MNDILKIISSEHKNKIKQIEIPTWINPMLATLTEDYFDDPDWIYERKFDGERCIVYCEDSEIRLMSRNQKQLNNQFPEIVKALEQSKKANYIIDGEIVAFEGKTTSFSKLQKRMHLKKNEDIETSSISVYYYIFDILYLDKFDVRSLPLKERKKVLKQYFEFETPLFYTTHQIEKGISILNTACNKKWEGIIAKKYDSSYQSSRSNKWLKFKCDMSQEFIIIGYTKPHGERVGFGALLVGYYDNERLLYAGKVGTGYTDEMLDDISKLLKDIQTNERPVKGSIPLNGNEITWVKPEIVCEIQFTEWTQNNKLRHPSFKGIRDDKPAKNVVKEGGKSGNK